MKRLSNVLLLAVLAASSVTALADGRPTANSAAFNEARQNTLSTAQIKAQPPVLLALVDDAALGGQRNSTGQFASSPPQPSDSAFNVWGMLAAAFGIAVMSIVRRMNHS